MLQYRIPNLAHFVFGLVAFVLLAGCVHETTPQWRADGLAWSTNMALSDEVAALAGRQGSDELAATNEFSTFICLDGSVDSDELEIVQELFFTEPGDEVLYFFNSNLYADLTGADKSARQLLGILLVEGCPANESNR